MKGCDTNRVLTPTLIDCLKKQGNGFICRYLRNLTHDEVQFISNAGLQIVSIHELGSPTSALYFSYQRGVQDGRIATQSALRIGQPQGTIIYATVDYDAVPAHLSVIAAYFQGFREGINQVNPSFRVGGYGSGLVLTNLLKAGLIESAWLCGSTGYQGYSTFTNWNIKQGKQISSCGILIDTDEARGDFGSWGYQPVQPAPQPNLPLIMRGSHGAPVLILQDYFVQLGKLKANQVDGIFGMLTEALVRAFQEDEGLQVDGRAGQNTWKALQEAVKTKG